ncbi:MAG: sulfatase-like hydrolase/transferase [Acidobacteria bacterium]|nr:sulfatase-like hydrolase/transferase [Acidobacteriota bacterium]
MRRLLLALLLIGSGCATEQAVRPNFVLVLTDDQGYGDLAAHGNEHIRTPNLDRMAREGVEFERFYVEPVCAPTRSALMTGRYHYRTGIIHTSRGGAKMHSDETTLAEMLRAAGYRTGIFGKWHLGDNDPMRPIDQGFEEAVWHKSGGIDQSPDRPNSYFDPWLYRGAERFQAKGYCTDVFFREALDFIGRHADEPFFVYLPTNAPHDPLQVADELWKPYAEMGLDEKTARVYGMVQNIDDNMGRLFEKLDALGLRENTVVVFLTDNGPQRARYVAGLRGTKSDVYEGGIRSISLWQGPDFAAPRKVERFGAHVDVVPTFLEAAGLEPPAGVRLDGRSLLPLLRGEGAEWPERTHFTQVHRGLDVHLAHNAAAITDRYKLVLSPDTFAQEDPPPHLRRRQTHHLEHRDRRRRPLRDDRAAGRRRAGQGGQGRPGGQRRPGGNADLRGRAHGDIRPAGRSGAAGSLVRGGRRAPAHPRPEQPSRRRDRALVGWRWATMSARVYLGVRWFVRDGFNALQPRQGCLRIDRREISAAHHCATSGRPISSAYRPTHRLRTFLSQL